MQYKNITSLFSKNRVLLLRTFNSYKMENTGETVITEGLAKVTTTGNVFYNPVQEFNRDLSISVINAFASVYNADKNKKGKPVDGEVTVTIKTPGQDERKPGTKYEDGLTILEALSATGLRSIRYAKEIAGVRNIVANDLSSSAVESIKKNIADNDVQDLVTGNQNDATMVMYEHRMSYDKKFDVIDLDPYGCPSIFLDGAVQAVKNGGLLLITATDMAVLAGNSPETCYSKYGSVSLKIKSCHEMALRILLQCIESHANRYGRYIVPLLSISADFYIRVFVRVYSGAHKCKFTTSKLSMVYHCTGCDSFNLQPLGVVRKNEKKPNNVKFCLPTSPFATTNCEHCKHPCHMGGPIWSAPLHDLEFVQKVLNTLSPTLNTYKRIEGVLTVVTEELQDVPLYYTVDRLSGTLHCETPPMLDLRSAILNAGFKVSSTHMNKNSLKTNAPPRTVWDIMRCWVKDHPVSEKRLAENSPARNILSIEPEKTHSFERHLEANPESRRKNLLRFQENPLRYWGPGTRATAMVGEEKISKSKRNQGKRKRETSEEENSTS